MKSLDKIWLRTTINGANEKTHEMIYPKGSYKTLINAVSLALKTGIKLKVRVTVTKKNIKELPAVVDLVSGLGITEIDFRPYAPLSQQEHDEFVLSVEEHLTALKCILELREAYPSVKIKLLPNWFDYIILPKEDLGDCALCNCGKTYLYIDSNGDILTCAGYRNALGNIYRDNILDVFNDTPFLAEIKKEKFGKYCQSCPVYFQCRRSNCHIVNFELFNTLDSTNPLCPIFKLSPGNAQTGYEKVRGIYHSLK
jgi:radical SAM protein with 4Fe4S-binding SPASM domain